MRIEIQEPARARFTRPRREAERVRAPLEPLAVDAAMADDLAEETTDERVELLESLVEQLDMLQEQQRRIRSLLDRAGHRRVDQANA